ncbi:MAG: hypothetical protein ACTHOD_21525 [Motilibacteraceae bacterium]
MGDGGFADRVNPTHDEIRAWAYRGGWEPMQDWDVIIAELDNLDVLLELVGDPDCPSRDYLVGALYCLAGHSEHSDPVLVAAAVLAERSSDSWVSTWGRRVLEVVDHPERFNRDEWCGWFGLRDRPAG